MTPTHSFDKPVLRAALDEIIRTHGLWPVLRATLARTLRRPPRSLAHLPISNHVRRDIGLDPLPDRKPWPLRP